MEAFWELSSTRNFGFVVGPIPWHRMIHYAEHKGLEPDMVEVFVKVLRELDEAYLKWQTGRQKKQLGAEQPDAKQSAQDVKARRRR